MEEWSSYIRSTLVCCAGTYSLLVCDVQLWLSIRLQLVLLKSCVDPSILHNLLQKQSERKKTSKTSWCFEHNYNFPGLQKTNICSTQKKPPVRSKRLSGVNNMSIIGAKVKSAEVLQPQTIKASTQMQKPAQPLCYSITVNNSNGITATSHLFAPLFSICIWSIALWGFTKDSQTNYQWSCSDRSSPQTSVHLRPLSPHVSGMSAFSDSEPENQFSRILFSGITCIKRPI